MSEIPLEKIEKLVKRLYGYLRRFQDDGMKIDIFYVMARIIFGNDTKPFKKRIEELINP